MSEQGHRPRMEQAQEAEPDYGHHIIIDVLRRKRARGDADLDGQDRVILALADERDRLLSVVEAIRAYAQRVDEIQRTAAATEHHHNNPEWLRVRRELRGLDFRAAQAFDNPHLDADSASPGGAS